MYIVNTCDQCGEKFKSAKSCWGPVLTPCIFKFPKNPRDWIRRPQDRKSDECELAIMSYCPSCGRAGAVDVARWFRISKVIRNGFGETVEREYNGDAKRELDSATRTLPVFEVDHPFKPFVDIRKE